MPMEISTAEERQLVQRARDAIESGDQCDIEAVLLDYCDALARKEDFRHASLHNHSAAHMLLLLPFWPRRPDAQCRRLLCDAAVSDLPQHVAEEFAALGVWGCGRVAMFGLKCDTLSPSCADLSHLHVPRPSHLLLEHAHREDGAAVLRAVSHARF